MAERGEGACGCSGKEEDRLRGRRKIKGAAVEKKEEVSVWEKKMMVEPAAKLEACAGG